MSQTKFVEKITTSILCSVSFLLENLAVNENYCRAGGRPQMTTAIWRMAPNATNSVTMVEGKGLSNTLYHSAHLVNHVCVKVKRFRWPFCLRRKYAAV
jgi:hypothetical protein